MTRITNEDIGDSELTITLERVCDIVQKSRVVMEKVEDTDPDSGSNPTDDESIDVLEELADDPAYEELTGALESLNEDEQIELLALIWLGRGDFTIDSWEEALEAAREVRHRHVAQYLSQTPRAPDYLEEGLAVLGYSCL